MAVKVNCRRPVKTRIRTCSFPRVTFSSYFYDFIRICDNKNSRIWDDGRLSMPGLTMSLENSMEQESTGCRIAVFEIRDSASCSRIGEVGLDLVGHAAVRSTLGRVSHCFSMYFIKKQIPDRKQACDSLPFRIRGCPESSETRDTRARYEKSSDAIFLISCLMYFDVLSI